MDILIIEDEAAAAKRLQKLIQKLLPAANILGVLDSVEEAVDWIKANPTPDLMMLDIHLADGSSFEIFQEVEIDCPIIFTTAYDQYAIQAFKVNSIDYLLKPLKEEDLAHALNKYQKLRQESASPSFDYTALLEAVKPTSSFQKRIVIRYGQHIKAIDIAEAAYFFIESKVSILRTYGGKDYPVDHNLDQLEGILDPAKFFRINRKCIVNIEAIDQMYTYSKSRVRLLLKPAFDQETIVSSERASRFKQWLKG
ncbi:MAG: LytTR family DNA-binding domain-containing protein [Bacteroidota bacterium]